ncbi:MAG: hypothetical protein ACRYGP_10985 [Janthinobacterium lividum]
MVAISSSQQAAPIRYALSHRMLAGNSVDIVLDLYRDALPILTRTIARVSDAELGQVTLKCRSYLERRGAQPVASPPPLARARAASKPQPVSAPAAAFDCLFAS